MRATTWMLLYGLLVGQFYGDYCRASPVGGTDVAGSGENQDYQEDDYTYNDDDESDNPPPLSMEEKVAPPPYFEQKDLTMHARPGDDVIITCDARNFDISNVAMWYKNQTILANGQSAINNRVEVMPNNSLRIRGVVAEDADDYYCRVLPQDVTQHTALRVGGRLSILCDDRDVTDRSQTFKQGDHHRLVCRTYLPGKTDIKWAFNGQRLQTSPEDAANGVVVLENVDEDNAGVYQCLGEDGSANPPHGILTIDVQYSPKVSTHRHHVNTQEGDTAEVYCDYRANPIAVSFFSKDGKTLSLSEKYSIKNSLHKEHNRTTLFVKNVDANDLGEYRCHVENSIGANEMRVKLQYSPETPQFEGHEIKGNQVTMHWLVRSLQPLSEAILDYKLTGSYTWSTVSMIQTQRHDKDSGIWKITHQIELTPGLWHARVKAKNTQGWSNFSPDHDFEIKDIPDEGALEEVEMPPGDMVVRAGFGPGSKTGGASKTTSTALLLMMTSALLAALRRL